MPTTTIRPRGFSAFRLPGKCGAPTSSRITSAFTSSAKAVIGDRLGAELAHQRRRLLAAHDAVHAGAGGEADLQRRRADAAVRAVHQQRLAHRQPAAGADRVVGGDERLRDGRRVELVQVRRHARDASLVHRHAIRQSPAADEAEHAVTGPESEHLVADRLDRARHLEPGDVGRRARRGRVVAGALVQVGRVEAGVADAHEHLAAAGDGIGTLLEVDDLAAAGPGEHDATHPRNITGHRTRCCPAPVGHPAARGRGGRRDAGRVLTDRARRGASGSLYRQAALAGLNSHFRGPARRHQGRLLWR